MAFQTPITVKEAVHAVHMETGIRPAIFAIPPRNKSEAD